jgi:membrane fusion protein, heavy metal efflux system
VRATVANLGGVLKPEMFANFSVTTGEGRNSVAVAEDAVIYDGTTARVWVARSRDKTVSLRLVKPGRTANGDVEILSGLRAGELVVTGGSLFIDRAAQSE